MYRPPVRRRFSTDDRRAPPPGATSDPDALASDAGAQLRKVLVVDDQHDLAELADRRKRYLFAPKPYHIATILTLLRS